MSIPDDNIDDSWYPQPDDVIRPTPADHRARERLSVLAQNWEQMEQAIEILDDSPYALDLEPALEQIERVQIEIEQEEDMLYPIYEEAFPEEAQELYQQAKEESDDL